MTYFKIDSIDVLKHDEEYFKISDRYYNGTNDRLRLNYGPTCRELNDLNYFNGGLYTIYYNGIGSIGFGLHLMDDWAFIARLVVCPLAHQNLPALFKIVELVDSMGLNGIIYTMNQENAAFKRRRRMYISQEPVGEYYFKNAEVHEKFKWIDHPVWYRNTKQYACYYHLRGKMIELEKYDEKLHTN